jgi:hypothetical protein
MTAALEGEGSAIEVILEKAPQAANSEKRASRKAAEEERPATLAERIRALQKSARQNKAS